MRNAIMIMVDCSNINIIYTATVDEAKKEIISYFGKKHIVINEPNKSFIILDCEVDTDDIKIIKEAFDEDSVTFLVMKNSESKCIVGDFINLPE
jgi:hypothetical protein